MWEQHSVHDIYINNLKYVFDICSHLIVIYTYQYQLYQSKTSEGIYHDIPPCHPVMSLLMWDPKSATFWPGSITDAEWDFNIQVYPKISNPQKSPTWIPKWWNIPESGIWEISNFRWNVHRFRESPEISNLESRNSSPKFRDVSRPVLLANLRSPEASVLEDHERRCHVDSDDVYHDIYMWLYVYI